MAFDRESNSRLLIVDDDAINRDMLSTSMDMAGYTQITAVGDGQAALDSIEHDMPDAILLDVMLPGIDGLEVTRRIRQDYPHSNVPIILISAVIDPMKRVQGIQMGANDFISKPFDTSELVARVKSQLSHKYALDNLQTERERLSILYLVSQAFTQLDYDHVINRIVSLTTELTRAAKSILVPLDELGNFQYKFVSRRGEETHSIDQIETEVLYHGLLGWVLEHGKSALVNDVSQDTRWTELPDDPEPTGSVIGVPLLKGKQVVGALLVMSPEVGAFTEAQLDLLSAVGSQAVIALENAKLFEDARRERVRAEALLTQIGSPVVVADSYGTIVQLNPACEHAFDITQDVLGRGIGEVFSASLADLLLRSKERGQMVSGGFTPRKQSGDERRSYNVSISPIELVGYILNFQDITGIKESERVRLDLERAEAQRIRDAFSRYMSTKLLDRILTDREILKRRERRESVVLFADLRGFTRLTVEHEPDAVITLLNDHFTAMMEIVDIHEGLVFDITGDELLVAFNVPYDQDKVNQRALLTAIDMQKRFAEMRSVWTARGMEVGLGIGINRGQVVLGHIGGSAQVTYTMVGQAVNIGHRLVEIAEDSQILVSPEVLSDGLPDRDGVTIEELEPRLVKGQKDLQAITALRVTGELSGRKGKRRKS